MRDRLYKRGKIYWARVPRPGGGTTRTSTHCTDRRAAEAAYARLEREAFGAPRVPTDAPAYTVGQAVAALVADGCSGLAAGTIEMYEQKGGHLRRVIGDVDVNALALEDGKRYVAQRLAEGAARPTVQKELVTLRRALAGAHEVGLFTKDPRAVVPRFKVRYVPRRRWLTPDQAGALLGVLQLHRQLWVGVAVYTGARYSEIAGLRWDDIDFARKTVHLRGTKTEGSDRVVPLAAPLARALGRVRRGRHARLVVGAWGNVRRDLAAACARAKVPTVSPNDLRRTFASWLKQAGEDSFIVAQLLGHSSSRMVELVYGRLSEATMAGAISKLPGGDCAAGVPPSGPSASPMSLYVRSDLLEMIGSPVPQGGIEPPTRGFSGRQPEAAKDEWRRALLRR
jgi:integrase